MNIEFNFDQNFINKIKTLFKKKITSNFAIKYTLNQNISLQYEINEYLKKYPQLVTPSKLILYICKDITLPKCTCGKLLTMTQYQQKRQYCSVLCKRKYFIFSEESKKQKAINIRKTWLEKYGGSNISKLQEVKNKRNKTNLLKYGCINPAQNKEIYNKIKDTCFKKYGVSNPMQNNIIKKRLEDVILKQYGVKNMLQHESVRLKNRQLRLKEGYAHILLFKKFNIIPLFSEDEYKGVYSQKVYKWQCTKCGSIFEQKMYTTHFNKEFDLLPRCLKCFPKSLPYSLEEKELADFCRNYFPNLKTNDKILLKPLEVDVIIPEIKLAIEFNGLYYHQVNDKFGVKTNYHLNKVLAANEKGYRLIHIWEDEWKNNKEEIKNKLIQIFEGKEIIDYSQKLDRSWYNNLEGHFKELPPEIITREKFKVENCGYLLKVI